MMVELFNKIKNFEEHHQVLFALVVVLGIVCFSWGVENILESYLFPRNPVCGYVVAIAFGLFLLWLSKYVILQVM
ncbi:hypothetical protein H0X48_03535 [Candidatus Dependentiae bacterium]|nr:hypothetical protein [Candidatus Dependentiae bacterium]